MVEFSFPVIDAVATGENIRRLRIANGLSVQDLQHWFNFQEPRAIYKWQSGQSLPSIDNLFALSRLFNVPMNSILIEMKNINDSKTLPQENPAVFSDIIFAEEQKKIVSI